MISTYIIIFSIFQNPQKMAKQSQMIKYINLARQSPSYYISIINKQLQSFINDKQMPISQGMIYQTNQGKFVWKQAKQFLQKQSALAPFEIHQGLNLSAKSHAQDLAAHNMFGHTGFDKSTFSERILQYCRKGSGTMAEIIGADFYLQGRNNAEMTVLGLIIDDGVTDRGHRKTIFNPQYRYIGCKSQVQGDKIITVFNLTQNKLQLKNQQKSIIEDYEKASSTMPSVKQSKFQNNRLLNKTQNDNFRNKSKSKYSFQRPLFNDLSQNLAQLKSSLSPSKQGSKNVQVKGNKKIKERKQNMKIYYEQGSKITQKYTQIYYSDGTKQENIERHTVYS